MPINCDVAIPNSVRTPLLAQNRISLCGIGRMRNVSVCLYVGHDRNNG